MNHRNRYIPYLLLALICGTASVVIVFLAMMTLGHGGGPMTEGNMYGIAAMAAAPAVMGIGIARYFPHDRQ